MVGHRFILDLFLCIQCIEVAWGFTPYEQYGSNHNYNYYSSRPVIAERCPADSTCLRKEECPSKRIVDSFGYSCQDGYVCCYLSYGYQTYSGANEYQDDYYGNSGYPQEYYGGSTYNHYQSYTPYSSYGNYQHGHPDHGYVDYGNSAYEYQNYHSTDEQTGYNVEADFYEAGYYGPQMSQTAIKIMKTYNYHKQCGVLKPQPSGRIATGYTPDLGTTAFGEYTWHAALLIKLSTRHRTYKNVYRYHCGATVIHPSLLITAAHCVKGIKKEKLKIHLGEWNLQGSIGELFPTIKRTVKKVIIHKRYEPERFIHDIAILLLNRPVDFSHTPHITPICLPPADFKFKEHLKCFIVGWGTDVYKPDYGSNILKAASVSLLDDNDCKGKLTGNTPNLSQHFFHDTHRCIQGAYGRDACIGDGGGALACPLESDKTPEACKLYHDCDPDHYYLAGVIAWGSETCGENGTTVITDMPSHISWLEQILSPAGGLHHFNDRYWKDEYDYNGYGNFDKHDYTSQYKGYGSYNTDYLNIGSKGYYSEEEQYFH